MARSTQTKSDQSGDFAEPIVLAEPDVQRAPVVLTSPHSGRLYPQVFLNQSRLDALSLRRSEDSFVDELFDKGPDLGVPLLCANFPRAYCDANREPYELDPRMFKDKLPPHANTRSVRVACGLGTIARVVGDSTDIYREKLVYADAERRIETCYRPYHATLARLLHRTHQKFGQVLLLDCHSMPSIGGPLDQDAGHGRADIVLGDRYGTSCDPYLVDLVEAAFRREGYHVGRNAPYAGGYTTLTYGRPGRFVHAVQIEINRALYMDEQRIERGPEFETHRSAIARILRDIIAHFDAASQQIAAE